MKAEEEKGGREGRDRRSAGAARLGRRAPQRWGWRTEVEGVLGCGKSWGALVPRAMARRRRAGGGRTGQAGAWAGGLGVWSHVSEAGPPQVAT